MPHRPKIPQSTEQSQDQNGRQSSTEDGHVASRAARVYGTRLAEQGRLHFDLEHGGQSEWSAQGSAKGFAKISGRICGCLREYGHFHCIVVARFEIAEKNDRLWPSRIGQQFSQPSAEDFYRRTGGQSVSSQQDGEPGTGWTRRGLSGPTGGRCGQSGRPYSSSSLDGAAFAPRWTRWS